MNSIFPVITTQVHNLPLYVHSIGIQHKQNELARPTGHPSNQLAYCLEGQGFIEVDHNRVTIKAGDVFFLKQNTPHTYGPTGSSFVIKWVIFDGASCQSFLEALSFQSFFMWHIQDMRQIEEKFQEIYERLLSQVDTFQYSVSAKMYELLLLMKEAMEQPSKSVVNRKSKEMAEFIEANYHRDISLEDITKVVNRSVYHGCKLFKQEMQTTMLKYLEDTRIKHAKRLLLQDDYKTIERLAEQVGYRSGNYFCRVFKKNEGVTPMQFRIYMGGV